MAGIYNISRNIIKGFLQSAKICPSSQRFVTSCCQLHQKETTSAKSYPNKIIRASPETSKRYLESDAYKETYGDKLVWELYRRNFKGQYPPPTRKKCIRAEYIATGNPCPICRDEFLVLHHTNVKLLQQFICPHSGEILPSIKTGICQQTFRTLQIEVAIAIDLGLIEMMVPFRKYNYSDYID
ncbi:ribosomal S18b, mitochondrial-like [Octopus vulgaris]|uniref:Ribosomal S18b, mitochondrial-like n=2 Tax=Octopus TaxID=6643 RepID=A0AA36FBK9_OCTVU|nr:28S ribosomal protein S18b, mitochondrial isoform X2 [Octopus sinensis]CAI9728888.1 ribosomal S18b, mitochondrial-like [Octopus vulgaris]